MSIQLSSENPSNKRNLLVTELFLSETTVQRVMGLKDIVMETGDIVQVESLVMQTLHLSKEKIWN